MARSWLRRPPDELDKQGASCQQEIMKSRGTVSLRFLGTGAGDFPALADEANREGFLGRARELGGWNLRYAPSTFLSPDILIDFYDDRGLLSCGVSAESVRYLFITHGHWDHFRPRQILDFASGLPHRLEIYGNEKVQNALDFAAEHRWDEESGRFLRQESDSDVHFHLLRPGDTVTTGETVVTAVHGNHSIDKKNMTLEERALHYVFQRSGRTVLYALDSSYTLPETFETLREFHLDVAVVDATFGHRVIDPAVSGHHNFEMLDETLGEYRDAGIIDDDTLVIASHISLASVEPHDEVVGELAAKGITLAYDGMHVEL